MKRIIKLCAAVLAAAAVFTLAGCSARTPVTADEFKKQAESAGFTVTDSASTNTDIEKSLSAVKSETGTELAFVSFTTESAASEMYAKVKSSISDGTGGTSNNIDSSSYNKYTLVNGELNHTLVRMNKTIVYGKATTSYKSQMDDLFKAIKY
nr:hypothetical protein [uncultured Caproiciproducens sp.]